MPPRVLVAGPPPLVDRVADPLRASFRVTVATDRGRARALSSLGCFQAIVTLDGFVRADHPRVVALASGAPIDDLLARVHAAVEAGHLQDLEHASSRDDLATLPYEEYLDHLRFGGTRAYLAALLTVHRGSVTDAARAAGLVRESLHRLLRRHGLDAEQFRPR